MVRAFPGAPSTGPNPIGAVDRCSKRLDRRRRDGGPDHRDSIRILGDSSLVHPVLTADIGMVGPSARDVDCTDRRMRFGAAAASRAAKRTPVPCALDPT